MTRDMENLESLFPPKHLGDEDVGHCAEAGGMEDTWQQPRFSFAPEAALTQLAHLLSSQCCSGTKNRVDFHFILTVSAADDPTHT